MSCDPSPLSRPPNPTLGELVKTQPAPPHPTPHHPPPYPAPPPQVQFDPVSVSTEVVDAAEDCGFDGTLLSLVGPQAPGNMEVRIGGRGRGRGGQGGGLGGRGRRACRQAGEDGLQIMRHLGGARAVLGVAGQSLPVLQQGFSLLPVTPPAAPPSGGAPAGARHGTRVVLRRSGERSDCAGGRGQRGGVAHAGRGRGAHRPGSDPAGRGGAVRVRQYGKNTSGCVGRNRMCGFLSGEGLGFGGEGEPGSKV